jgi:hypothetical protein
MASGWVCPSPAGAPRGMVAEAGDAGGDTEATRMGTEGHRCYLAAPERPRDRLGGLVDLSSPLMAAAANPAWWPLSG